MFSRVIRAAARPTAVRAWARPQMPTAGPPAFQFRGLAGQARLSADQIRKQLATVKAAITVRVRQRIVEARSPFLSFSR